MSELETHGDALGMTLRDYFAAKALPHALARSRYEIDRYGDRSAMDHIPGGAKMAYRIDDAMLEARMCK